jgi:hypothetical protein
MADISKLLGRIDAEFSASDQKVKEFQQTKIQSFEDRERRLDRFSKLLDELKEVWRPRLDALSERFKDRVKATPTVAREGRTGVFEFQSDLAHIKLCFAAGTDAEAQRVVFTCDLDILPIFMQFEKHAEIAFPLDAIDRDALGAWMDDRIVYFVKTYLSLHENESYLRAHMVEDPIARIRFPKFAAGATLEEGGKTIYFVGERTRDEFVKSRQGGAGTAEPRPASKATKGPAKR